MIYDWSKVPNHLNWLVRESYFGNVYGFVKEPVGFHEKNGGGLFPYDGLGDRYRLDDNQYESIKSDVLLFNVPYLYSLESRKTGGITKDVAEWLAFCGFKREFRRSAGFSFASNERFHYDGFYTQHHEFDRNCLIVKHDQSLINKVYKSLSIDFYCSLYLIASFPEDEYAVFVEGRK